MNTNPKTIWKFPFTVSDEVRVDMPARAQVLSVQLQNGQPTMWALVDPEARLVTHRFRVFGTGHPVPFGIITAQFVGTFQMHGGALVFHLFSDGTE